MRTIKIDDCLRCKFVHKRYNCGLEALRCVLADEEMDLLVETGLCCGANPDSVTPPETCPLPVRVVLRNTEGQQNG